MHFRTLAVSLVLLAPLADRGEALTLLASYGRFERDASQQSFSSVEAFQDDGGLMDFELTILNHYEDSDTIVDSLHVIYRGLGFDFKILRLNFDIGNFFSLDKYALDEIDYGVSRSIVGGGFSLDLNFVQLHGFSHSYIPTSSQKAQIDSFQLTYNPYTYQQSEAGLTLNPGPLTLRADLGRLDHLQGRYDILGDNFVVTAPAVSYGKLALIIKGSNHTALRLEAHKILNRLDKRSNFHKFIGTAMHRDAYNGGSLGLGFAF